MVGEKCSKVMTSKWLQNLVDNTKALLQMPPVVIDGATIILIQMLTVLSTQLGTDEAAKYIAPVPLFWIKVVTGELAAGLLALKMFRSTGYAAYQQQKQQGNTDEWRKQQVAAEAATQKQKETQP